MSGSNLLFILSGSIACYKACDVISRLVQAGHAVRTVATETALRFVGAATLEGLTGQRVAHALWAEGEALAHIQLTRWADAVIICPATAHTLNRLATGFADDLVGALFLARDPAKPWLVAPAMNPAMWQHPATQASVATLTQWGLRFVPAGVGRTACGEQGEGRLAEPATLVAAITALLARPARRLRLLITSGGTAEPIDGVRVLTNTSTGATGAALVDHFARAGHDVHLLRAHSSHEPVFPCAQQRFTTSADLGEALQQQLGTRTFDAVLHAAAVSDFTVASVEVAGQPVTRAGKLASSAPAPILRLQPAPKLVTQLRAWSAPAPLIVVAFKLTHGASAPERLAAVRRLLDAGTADYVVHNDLAERSDATHFPAHIHAARHDGLIACPTRTDLAPALEKILLTHALVPTD